MRTFQIVVRKLLCAAVLLGGGALCVMSFSELYQTAISNLPGSPLLRIAGGAALIVGAVLGLLPLQRPRLSKNSISFQGPHGDVAIQLDSVETLLARVIGKMPEVKKISVRVEPTEDNHKARVYAYVWIAKGEEAAGVRELAIRISHHVADMAAHILGVEELTSVDLNVLGITVSAGAAKQVMQREVHVESGAAVAALAVEEPVAEEGKSEEAPIVETPGEEPPASVVDTEEPALEEVSDVAAAELPSAEEVPVWREPSEEASTEEAPEAEALPEEPEAEEREEEGAVEMVSDAMDIEARTSPPVPMLQADDEDDRSDELAEQESTSFGALDLRDAEDEEAPADPDEDRRDPLAY